MKNKGKFSILTVCLLLTVFVAVGSTIAYIFTSTDPVTNTFTPVENKSEIDEEFSGAVKKDVTIKNTGDVDSYIRAKVVITWQDTNGNIYPTDPVRNGHYTIEYAGEDGSATNWVLANDGFWYYKESVPAGGETKNLINEAVWTKECDDKNYSLHIEILSQAIQSTPDEAVNAWDNDKVELTGNSGTLTVANK